MRYFIGVNEEFCYSLKTFKEELREDGLDSIELWEMKRDYGGPMWCKLKQEFSEYTDECCGKINCDNYKPRNHKNGRCNFLENGFIDSGEKFLLTKKGLRKIEQRGTNG